MPLADRVDALQVNLCELTVTDAEGKVKDRNAFITDGTISADNVASLLLRMNPLAFDPHTLLE